MATALKLKFNIETIPARYKFNPYYDVKSRDERKAIEKNLRHKVKQVLSR
jgi:hypothetical protein